MIEQSRVTATEPPTRTRSAELASRATEEPSRRAGQPVEEGYRRVDEDTRSAPRAALQSKRQRRLGVELACTAKPWSTQSNKICFCLEV